MVLPKLASALVAALVSSLIAAVLSVAQGLIQAALQNKDKGPRKVESPSRAQKQNLNETVSYIPLVVGRSLVGGTRAFVAVKTAYKGTEIITSNGQQIEQDTEGNYAYIKTVHSLGECEEIEDIRFNDVSYTSKKFSNGYKVNVTWTWTYTESDPIEVFSQPGIWEVAGYIKLRTEYGFFNSLNITSQSYYTPVKYRLSFSPTGQDKWTIIKELQGGVQSFSVQHVYGEYDYKLEYIKDDGTIEEVGTATAEITQDNTDFNQSVNNNLTITQNSYLSSEYVSLNPVDLLGQAGQTAIAKWINQGVPGYSSELVGNGLCMTGVRLLKHIKGSKAEKQPFPTIPNITALVKGVKVYDPRKDSTNIEASGSGTHRENDPTTWEYTTNPILIIRYYLVHFNWGFKIDSSFIDDAMIKESADYCDTTVTYNGDTFKRFELNGVIDTGSPKEDILIDLLEACNAKFIRTPVNGYMKIRIKVMKPESSVKTFNFEEFMGNFDVTKTNLRQRTNTIHLKWTSEALNWETEIKTISNSNYVLEDGEVYESDMDLPFCIDYNHAYYLGIQKLKQSRLDQYITFERPFKDIDVNVGDVVTLNYEPMGFVNKLVRVEIMEYLETGTIRFECTEYDENVYTIDNIDPRSDYIDTNLPNPYLVTPPSNLSVYQNFEFGNLAQYKSTIQLTWKAPNYPNIREYQVEYKPYGSGDWSVLGKTSNTSLFTEAMLIGEYSVRLKAINNLGFESDYYEERVTIYAPTDNPPDVEGFTLKNSNNEVSLSWNIVPTVANNGFYRIKHVPTLNTPEWTEASTFDILVPGYQTSITLSQIDGSYLIKAVNSARLESLNFASVMLDLPQDTDWKLEVTAQEETSFAGTKVNVDIVDNELTLTGSSVLFDDRTGLFDDGSGLFDDGSGYNTVGTYVFSNSIDLSHVYRVKLKKTVQQTISQTGQNFDDAPGLFDDREGLFDGDDPVFTTVNVLFRVTRDDPAGIPTWSDWMELTVNEITGRAFQFRAELFTPSIEQKISISQLRAHVYLKRRVDQGTASITGASQTVSFTDNFYEAPGSVTINLLDGETGDYWRVANITRTGFDITIYNSSNSVVSRDINWLAQSYGEQLV